MSAAHDPTATRRLYSNWQCHALLGALTLLTLLIHGYHPFAEDGGVYVAGLEYRLDPTLFPQNTAFVSAFLAWSAFSTLLAQLVRLSHLPMGWILFLLYLCSVYATLYAAFRIARQAFSSQRTALFAAALFASWFTLPVAGTSLSLMDPYLTARSLSTPLALLAVSFALPPIQGPRAKRFVFAALCLLAAFALHPLMASYAAGFVLALVIAQLYSPRRRKLGWTAFAASIFILAAAIQIMAAAETPASLAADISRYYWFPSQWRWFELVGLAAPLLILALSGGFHARRERVLATALCRAATGFGIIACIVAVTFAQQHFPSHAIARLQPLRAFLVIYAVMTLVLAATLAEIATSFKGRISSFTLLAGISGVMCGVQRQTFSASQHLELPWRTPTNRWSQAFLWARDHTPPNALFALDANYISLPGEDAQTFRSTAQRSMLADFSKDGGEAAVTPSLAETWITQSVAQQDLSHLDDTQREARLQSFGVTWMVLQSSAKTLHACPYDNRTVKVCINFLPAPGPPQP